jgi:phage/plasmid-associated DNA primase
MLASNADWVVPASADERRYFVLDVSDHRKGDKAYFARLAAAIDGPELPAFLHHLLNLELSGFDHRNPPHTKALNEQKLIGGDSVQRFWFDCLTDGEIVGAEAGNSWPAMVPCTDLHDAYLEHAHVHGDRYPLPRQQMSKKLRKLCPDEKLRVLRPAKKHEDDPRPPRAFVLNSLGKHRAAFLKAMNIAEHEWPDVDGLS